MWWSTHQLLYRGFEGSAYCCVSVSRWGEKREQLIMALFTVADPINPIGGCTSLNISQVLMKSSFRPASHKIAICELLRTSLAVPRFRWRWPELHRVVHMGQDLPCLAVLRKVPHFLGYPSCSQINVLLKVVINPINHFFDPCSGSG